MGEANVWQPKFIPSLEADTKRVVEVTIAAEDQTVFTLNDFAYSLATNVLAVYVNGLQLVKDRDYTETSETSFTLLTPSEAGDIVTAIGFIGVSQEYIDTLEEYITNIQQLLEVFGANYAGIGYTLPTTDIVDGTRYYYIGNEFAVGGYLWVDGSIDPITGTNWTLVISGDLAEIEASLANLTTVVADADSALAASIAGVEADVDAAELDIVSANEAIAAALVRVTDSEGDITALMDADVTISGAITSNTSAITVLDSRTTTAEGAITSQSSDITSLQAEVTSLDSAQQGTANAVALLDTKTDATDVAVTSNASAITSLSGEVTTLDGAQQTNASAIATLTTNTAATDAEVTSQASDITALQSDLAILDTAQGVTASGLSTLDTRVTSTESSITSQATSLTSLQSQLDDLTVSEFDSATNYAIDDRFKYVSNVYKVIATQSQPNATPPNATYYELQADYATLENQVSANSSAITSLDTDVTALQGSVTTNSSDITALASEVTTLDTEVTAASDAATALDTRVTATETSISSQASDITALQSDVTGNTSSIGGNSTAISNLDTRVTGNDTDISAISSDITTLQSSLSTAESDIVAGASATNALTTRVTTAESDISSQATAVTSLTSATGANAANITSLTTTTDGLSARWEVKTVVGDLEGQVGFYNDGGEVVFGITSDGVDGLTYNLTTGVLKVRGDVEATSVGADALTGATIRTAASGERIEILSDGTITFYWDDSSGEGLRALAKIGDPGFAGTISMIGDVDFSYTAQECRNAGHPSVATFTGSIIPASKGESTKSAGLYGVSGRGAGIIGNSLVGQDYDRNFERPFSGGYASFAGSWAVLVPKASTATQGTAVEITQILAAFGIAVCMEVDVVTTDSSTDVFGIVLTVPMPFTEHDIGNHACLSNILQDNVGMTGYIATHNIAYVGIEGIVPATINLSNGNLAKGDTLVVDGSSGGSLRKGGAYNASTYIGSPLYAITGATITTTHLIKLGLR